MPEDVGKLFENQHVLILGGSFMRGVYKDLVWLLNHPSIIPRFDNFFFRKKMQKIDCPTNSVSQENMNQIPF